MKDIKPANFENEQSAASLKAGASAGVGTSTNTSTSTSTEVSAAAGTAPGDVERAAVLKFPLYDTLKWITWPGLLIVCLAITGAGFHLGWPMLYFNLAYAFLIVALVYLEYIMPYELKWKENDGQTWPSIAHTLTSKGTVQGILAFGSVIGIAELIKPVAEPLDYGIWPRDWPVWVQVILGVYAAEFMLYWAHRLGHEVPLFWRFHAVHHSVVRLWVINTGRFHFIDSLMSIVMGAGLLIALGAPLEVIQWLASITAFIGVLTHCNVDMKCGGLSYMFNTPELHRWHHSKKLREGNSNYGENVMVWDLFFRTFINPRDRRPPVNIGITDYMPTKFWQQLLWPFLTVKYKKKIYPDYVHKKFVYKNSKKA